MSTKQREYPLIQFYELSHESVRKVVIDTFIKDIRDRYYGLR